MNLVECTIDNREHALLENWSWAADVQACVVPMDIGDMCMSIQGEPIILFERKTIADLSASIADGRYKEQKIRLQAWLHAEPPGRRQCVYIIEGFKGYNEAAYRRYHGPSIHSVMSAILHSMHRDMFYVVTTQGLEDTRAYIEGVFKRIQKKPDAFLRTVPSHLSEKEDSTHTPSYGETIQLKKQKNITKDNVWMLMLSQIPGVSTKIATAITEVYPTAEAFFQGLASFSTHEDKVAHLRGLPVTTSTEEKKQRSIGPKTAQTILTYLGMMTES